MDVFIKVKKLSKKIGTEFADPSYSTDGSAGIDLVACIDEPVCIAPHEICLIPSGIAVSLPARGYAAMLYARSGLSSKHGITMANGVGVVDSDYRGEIKMPMINLSDVPYTIQPGDRVAQLVITPIYQAHLVFSDYLDKTERGEDGFGSTGN